MSNELATTGDVAIPFRLEVLRRLTEALEEITPANGYQHDLSEKVFRGRKYFGEGDPIPLVSILEKVDAPEPMFAPSNNPIRRAPWELIIQGWAVDDRLNPTDPAHALAADVAKRLAEILVSGGAEKTRLFNPWNTDRIKAPVSDIRIGAPIVHPPDEFSAYANFWLTLQLEVVENLTSPYQH